MSLIVIEGVDCSGKETQTVRLYERLVDEGKTVKRVSFPDYESESSAAVRMYLNGDFGKSAFDVNPYAASVLFAVDRFASYRTKWKKDLESGIVIADRYVTSNMVHQASKLDTREEKERFIEWLCDLEYGKMELPKPDKVIFLDMPPEMSAKLNLERKNKINGSDAKDIHERDLDYLKKSYENACFVADMQGWTVIKCAAAGKVRAIDDIAEEIYCKVKGN
ncbi:MAG: thymidylate kinase [Clostridia bacterium]|nr:thymidylate kinase [Clostridia bacterium]